MAISVVDASYVNGGNKSASTSDTIASTSTASVDDVIVFFLALDNAGASGASAFSSISQPTSGAVTWETALTVNRTPGSAVNDGVTLVVLVGKVTTEVPQFAEFTVSYSTSVTAKAWVGITLAGANPDWVNTNMNDGNASVIVATNSSPVRAVQTGDIVLGSVAKESATPGGGDSDTTNGTWSTVFNSSSGGGGSDATKTSVIYQYKIVTADGGQTYNSSASADYAARVITLEPAATGPATIEGTLSAALGGSASATAVVTHEATASGSFGGTATAAAAPVRDGVLSAALGALSASATATPQKVATLAASLGGSASATGDLTHPATLTGALGGAASASAVITHEASATGSLGGSASATATVTHEATASASGGFSASATADVTTPGSQVEGVLDAALGGSASATATVVHEATAAAAGGGTASATASITHLATLSAFFPFFSLVPDTGGIVTKHATLSGSLGGAAAATGDITHEATADASVAFSADLTGDVSAPGGVTEAELDAQLEFVAQAVSDVVHEANIDVSFGGVANASATVKHEATAELSLELVGDITGQVGTQIEAIAAALIEFEATYEYSPEGHEGRLYVPFGGLTASAVGVIEHPAVLVINFGELEGHMQGPGPRRRRRRPNSRLEARTLPTPGVRDPDHLTRIQRRTRGV